MWNEFGRHGRLDVRALSWDNALDDQGTEVEGNAIGGARTVRLLLRLQVELQIHRQEVIRRRGIGGLNVRNEIVLRVIMI